MAIKFLCPNGHKLRCKEDRAGRAAKCPQCGVEFYVPQVSPVQAFDSKLSMPGVGMVDAAVGHGVRDDQLEFLCPNGHRLATSGDLQGTPGQCPVCGCKFRIPTRGEIFGAAGDQDDATINLRASGDSSMDIQDFGDIDGEVSGEVTGEIELPLSHGRTHGDGVARSASPPAVMSLFSWLWATKSPSAVIEVHLQDGERIIPDRFAKKLSKGTHAVFVVDESNGTHTVTAVAWESIRRVQVRGIRRLPQALSE